jgi:type VI secretion system secreted protein VgrG
MTTIEELDLVRKAYNQKAHKMAFDYYLRKGVVPKTLITMIEETSFLEKFIEMLTQKYRSDQPRIPAGSSDGGQWTDSGGVGDANTVPIEGVVATNQIMNTDNAVSHLDAQARGGSIGKCAAYVRRAIQAGGIKLRTPYPISAKDYGPYLKEYGFSSVMPRPNPDYIPDKGDIVVIQSYSVLHPHGHIAMHNGSRWVSDFRQNGVDIWPGQGYRKYKPAYDIYRQ